LYQLTGVSKLFYLNLPTPPHLNSFFSCSSKPIKCPFEPHFTFHCTKTRQNQQSNNIANRLRSSLSFVDNQSQTTTPPLSEPCDIDSHNSYPPTPYQPASLPSLPSSSLPIHATVGVLPQQPTHKHINHFQFET